MDKEYLMLRDELLHLDTVVNNTINFYRVIKLPVYFCQCGCCHPVHVSHSMG